MKQNPPLMNAERSKPLPQINTDETLIGHSISKLWLRLRSSVLLLLEILLARKGTSSMITQQ